MAWHLLLKRGSLKVAWNYFREPETRVEVGVLPPGVPVGEPVVAEVAKTSVLLRWNAPEQDGGVKIDEYIVEKKR